MSRNRIKTARRNDLIARWVITTGGIAIIASVILILVLVLEVALPLVLPSRARPMARLELPEETGDGDVMAVALDDYLETAALLTRDGRFVFLDVTQGTFMEERTLRPGAMERPEIVYVEQYGARRFSVLWDDGVASLYALPMAAKFDESGKRRIDHTVVTVAEMKPADELRIQTSALRVDEDKRITRVDLLENGRLRVEQKSVEEDLFGNVEEKTLEVFPRVENDHITVIALDGPGHQLYAGTRGGYLRRWNLDEPGEAIAADRVAASEDQSAITALAMVFGDVSVAVGDARGRYSTWFPVRVAERGRARILTRIHDLKAHDRAIRFIRACGRSKSLLSTGGGRSIHLDHMTSERHLFDVRTPANVVAVAMTTRENGLIALDANRTLSIWSVRNPHPEVSLKTLFGKVWYEDYEEPEYVWQSSASSDDFEPKLSLVPLVFGSVKGTFYAMLFAIPLALCGAIYTSQFTPFRIRGLIKSTVEIMAAIPSVVIGFLVALWLAPIVEQWVVSFLLMLGIMPVVSIVFILLWQPLRKYTFAKRVENGYEFLFMIPLVLLSAWAAYALGGLVETVLFKGDLKMWLYESAGERFDQRNSIIIAFGLGFAVIPIIFTMAEDALSNVPRSLKAASLALGASRWQTVWRIVLPSASPGIFAAMIIGFGRAIGETMIVLMATGNTPVMDWSLFNGMRTLSANIAVEIPEAPVGGSLYRVLFLSAVLLLVLTSVLNTVAEVVRQHLRKKYGLHG